MPDEIRGLIHTRATRSEPTRGEGARSPGRRRPTQSRRRLARGRPRRRRTPRARRRLPVGTTRWTAIQRRSNSRADTNLSQAPLARGLAHAPPVRRLVSKTGDRGAAEDSAAQVEQVAQPRFRGNVSASRHERATTTFGYLRRPPLETRSGVRPRLLGDFVGCDTDDVGGGVGVCAFGTPEATGHPWAPRRPGAKVLAWRSSPLAGSQGWSTRRCSAPQPCSGATSAGPDAHDRPTISPHQLDRRERATQTIGFARTGARPARPLSRPRLAPRPTRASALSTGRVRFRSAVHGKHPGLGVAKLKPPGPDSESRWQQTLERLSGSVGRRTIPGPCGCPTPDAPMPRDAEKPAVAGLLRGATRRTRTDDLLITNELLYQLS